MARVSLVEDDEDETPIAIPVDAAPKAQLLPFDQAEPNPENIRHPQHKVAERAKDMAQRGQLHNANVMTRERFLAVKPYLADQLMGRPYVVINGCLRWKAGPLAGLKGLKYEVHDEWTADDIDEAMLAENIHRDAVNPMLLARKLAQMINRPKYQDSTGKASIRNLADAISKPHPWVQQRLDLVKLHPELQSAIEEERIKFALARECARLHEDLQPHLAAGALPVEVARAWLVVHRIKAAEQLRRWKAGAPFDVGPYVDPEVGQSKPKSTARTSAFTFRATERSPQAVATAFVEACIKAEVDLDEVIDELTKAKASSG